MLKYINNVLNIESVAIDSIAKTIPTPFYIYSVAKIESNFFAYQKHLPNALICYAIKANSNLSIIKLLGSLGAGADCVSEGEIRRAIKSGIPPSKIVFSGVGKTKQELEFALKHNIFQFNVESIEEISLLNEVAKNLKQTANIGLRLNLDVDSKTHHKISTGQKSDKFGIDIDLLPEILTVLADSKNLSLQGLSVHIGSQITDLSPYETAYKRLLSFAEKFVANGYEIKYLDLGGGLGINYDSTNVPAVEEYANLVNSLFAKQHYKIIIEPGRSIVGNAGLLVSSVTYIKKTTDKYFAILDTGMNDLIRQSLYDAFHDIIPVKLQNQSTERYDFVGPICESSDVFLQNKQISKLYAGDLVAFKDAGAYGSSMSSTYNSRPLIAEILVNDAQFTLIRKKMTFDEMFEPEETGLSL